ncbi:hypothetical protein LTR40_008557, partial [Exophiala xenobiotica]
MTRTFAQIVNFIGQYADAGMQPAMVTDGQLFFANYTGSAPGNSGIGQMLPDHVKCDIRIPER